MWRTVWAKKRGKYRIDNSLRKIAILTRSIKTSEKVGFAKSVVSTSKATANKNLKQKKLFGVIKRNQHLSHLTKLKVLEENYKPTEIKILYQDANQETQNEERNERRKWKLILWWRWDKEAQETFYRTKWKRKKKKTRLKK